MVNVYSLDLLLTFMDITGRHRIFMATRITAISDTHTYHKQLKIEPTDVLLHAGDYTSIGKLQEVTSFLKWFDEQPAKHKVFIDGNHDGLSEEWPVLFTELLKQYPCIHYLRHEGIELEGIKIWGRPTTPTFGEWWHMADRDSHKMSSTLSVIPKDTDILLTHGPAAFILDKTLRGEHVGCKDLLSELDRVKCKYMIFGHIHQSSGIKKVGRTTHINAAVLDDHYKMTFPPKVFDF
jgi:Icc-related predicted phosphoesterase